MNCISENSFEPEGGETKTMKKLTLITAALALLGSASIVGAANQNAKSAKIKSTQLRRSKQNAADKPDAAEVAARRPTATSDRSSGRRTPPRCPRRNSEPRWQTRSYFTIFRTLGFRIP